MIKKNEIYFYEINKAKINLDNLEFEKVFTYAGTDKDDDAQLKIGLSYQSIGNVNKAKEEFQRLVDYFPGSEYYPKAKEALKQLSLN